jgi:hypothetical protein
MNAIPSLLEDEQGMGASASQTGLSQAEPEVSALSGFDPSRWQWWSGPDDEIYRCGPCATREEAISEAQSNYDDAEVIYVVEATSQIWPAPSARSVIDDMFENSDDLFSEDYPEPIGTDAQMQEAESELQAALDCWMEKWRHVIFPEPTRFGRTRNEEAIAASGMEAGTGETEGLDPKDGSPTSEAGDAQ